jgi:hypothetical protein
MPLKASTLQHLLLLSRKESGVCGEDFGERGHFFMKNYDSNLLTDKRIKSNTIE